MKKSICLLCIILLFAHFSCKKQDNSDSPEGKEERIIKINVPEIEMIRLPAASFRMGSGDGDADETPVHTVVLTKSILMGKYEITNRQVAAVYTWGLMNGKIKADGETVVQTPGGESELIDIDYPDCRLRITDKGFMVSEGFEDHPCTLITWYGTVIFCNLLSEIEGRESVYDPADYSCAWEKNGYRLPTEAEWEFAARGGTENRGFVYSGSNNPDEVAWFNDNAGDGTHPVGMKAPNECGFYDMSGNVWECCWDYYGYYIPEIIDDHTFEYDLPGKTRYPYHKDYITRIYTQNMETMDYELSPALTNEECRITWEVFSSIGYMMDSRIDPKGIRYRNKRVLRGGDWGSILFYLRTTYRGRVFAQVSSTGYGFRVVRLDT